MTAALKPHMEILSPAQLELWPALKPIGNLGFALYGGTAISLRLGHRQSIDLDFFSERPLDRKALHAALPFLDKSTIIQDQPDTLSALVPSNDPTADQAKVSFFGTIGFGRVGAPDITNDGVLHIASLDDLMATKVKTILQRVEAKDYRDIAAMINANVSLSKGLAAARKMHGPNFQPSESLKAMVYFKGGDLHTLTKNEKNTLINAVSDVRDLPEVQILSHQLTASARTLPSTQSKSEAKTHDSPTARSHLLSEMTRAARKRKNERER